MRSNSTLASVVTGEARMSAAEDKNKNAAKPHLAFSRRHAGGPIWKRAADILFEDLCRVRQTRASRIDDTPSTSAAN